MPRKHLFLLAALFPSIGLAACSAGLEAHLTYDSAALKFSGDKAYETLVA